jgi:type II secretion system protein N
MFGLGVGFGLLLGGCASGPPTAEKGAFKLEDVVHVGDTGMRVQVNRREVPLEQMPIAALLGGLPMTGLADIAIDLTVPAASGKQDFRKAAGSIAFACPAGCTLGDDTAKLQIAKAADGISFGHIAFDEVDLRAKIDKGHVKVTRWMLASADLMLELRLDIELATDLADSTLDGCLRFKPSPSLEQRDPKTAAMIATTGAPRDSDGVYTIKIGGRVGQKKLLGQACT